MAPLCTVNTTAAPGPCGQGYLPLTPTPLRPPCTSQAPIAPGRGHGALTGHSHSKTTLKQKSDASSHPVTNTRVPILAHQGIALLLTSLDPRM